VRSVLTDIAYYSKGNKNRQFVEGQSIPASRPSVLTPGGTDYFTMKPPTYQEFSSNQVVNVKNVAGLPVRGDGTSDDTANINAVLAQSIGKVVYFPAGHYMVSDTVYIPPGSRIFGDPYASAINGLAVTKFFNPDAPTAMVQLGKPGDIGVGQVSDVLQGCKLVSFTPLHKPISPDILC
jgi:glucan 1,3-beta-glucosidase